MQILDNFKLSDEKEVYQTVHDNIESGIEFKGTKLWILIFAIFIASLGLNINATAVIIGAMLISPLMGPIMGLGFGMAINDLDLLRRSLFNYLFAAGVGLATSTLYFLITPINDAHSELLARTSPTIYDVLIAFFGGLAGILATSSRLKGNVIPGVAIATALMPPLCTAGYGLATLNPEFFFGAFYLFLINTVFIALATLITARVLDYPFKHLPKREDEIRAKRIVYTIVLLTFLPSLYFGYDLVQRDRFIDQAESFIAREAFFPNDYLLNKDIDPEKRSITLVYGGDIISEAEIENLRQKLVLYKLEGTTLTIQQGFAYLQQDNGENHRLNLALAEKEMEIHQLHSVLDSLADQHTLSMQVYRELKTQFPGIRSIILQPAFTSSATGQQRIWISQIQTTDELSDDDRSRIEEWIKVRINSNDLQISFLK